MTTHTLVNAIASRLGVNRRQLVLLVGREDRIVVRTTLPEGDDVAVKASPSGSAFAHEAAAMDTLRACGVPVSDVLLVEPGPPAILVTRWVHGEPITATSDAATLGEVGSVLRRIHSLPGSAPWSGHPTIEGWIEAWIHLVTQWWETVPTATATDRTTIRTWLDEVRPLLDDTVGRQMLFDGRTEHWLVGQDGGITLIDVADLQSGDPAMDLAVLELEAPGILPSVLAGYVSTPAERERLKQVIPFYALLRAMAAAEWHQRLESDSRVSPRYWRRAREMLAVRRGEELALGGKAG